MGAPRFGGPVSHVDVATLVKPAGSGRKMRRPCHARLREKSLEISNMFRKVLGLPLIKTIDTPAKVPEGKYRILPLMGVPPAIIEAKEGTAVREGKEGKPRHRHHHHHHKHHGHKGSFMKRLHFSIMALGPWEGRAVAFVLGM
jgi:hypothetical protein